MSAVWTEVRGLFTVQGERLREKAGEKEIEVQIYIESAEIGTIAQQDKSIFRESVEIENIAQQKREIRHWLLCFPLITDEGRFPQGKCEIKFET